MTKEEACEIVTNQTIHWSIRAKTVEKYVSENPNLGTLFVAYNLLLNEQNLFDYLRLAKACREYSQLDKVNKRIVALSLLNRFEQTPEKLRNEINIATTKIKLRSQRIKIKDIKANEQRQRKFNN